MGTDMLGKSPDVADIGHLEGTESAARPQDAQRSTAMKGTEPWRSN